jgi:hypothetical protein
VSRRARSFVRLLVAALAVLVAVGAAMPAYARLLGGPHAHSCSCEVRRGTTSGHAHCACPVCFPELDDMDAFGAPTVAGRCGTDDPGWRTLSAPAVPTPDFVIVAPLARVELPLTPLIAPTQWSDAPELPPPRT